MPEALYSEPSPTRRPNTHQQQQQWLKSRSMRAIGRGSVHAKLITQCAWRIGLNRELGHVRTLSQARPSDRQLQWHGTHHVMNANCMSGAESQRLCQKPLVPRHDRCSSRVS